METIGQRIKRLRKTNEWSRPELGRQMALAIGREKPFSGELVRLYEEGENRPSVDARKALAATFKLSEAYIEFGEQDAQQPATQYRSVSARALDVAQRFDKLSATCQEHVSHQIDLLSTTLANNVELDRAAQHDAVIKGGAVQSTALRKRRRS